MENLKDLMEKYGSTTTENALMDGVEVDMDPTVGVVENIINGENEETVKEAVESAVADAEKLEEISEDTEKLEEDVEAEEKEEATTESAIKIMARIEETLEKHGYKSDEDKAFMGFKKSDDLNTESAQSFPSATKDKAIAAGKTVVAKIKEAIKWIIDKIVKAFEAIKNNLLALVGNNAGTAKKLKGLLSGLEDKVAEGKEFNGDYASKFPFAHEINASTVSDSMISGEADKINTAIKLFIDGCASKSLEKFNKLEGITVSDAVSKIFHVHDAILVGVAGGKATGIVPKDDGVKLETVDVEGKAPALSAPLSNAELAKICDAVVSSSDKAKAFIEATKASFESIKNLKVEDEEFAKSAKIESTVSMLTSAKMKMLDALAKQPKVVLQFVAANVAAKPKKA